MNWVQAHDNTMPAPIPPVVRVSWAQQRAWHGATVTIRVRTIYVPDNSLVDIAIVTHGAILPVHTIMNLAIVNNTLDHNYVLDWKAIVLPVNTGQFDLVATLQDPVLASPVSASLHVDLLPPLFSA